MNIAPDLRLILPNHAENVTLVRRVLSGVAEAVGIEEGVLEDLKTAVSEACNNVVIHAYDGAQGPIEVDVQVAVGRVVTVVRDQGAGIKPRAVDDDSEIRGVGLSLITALADEVEFGQESGRGTEVKMTFAAAVDREGIIAAPDQTPGRPNGCDTPPDRVLLSVCSGVLAGPVLGALTAALGSRCLTVERLSDAQLVTDAITAHSDETFPGTYVDVAIRATDTALELQFGPMPVGQATALVARTEVEGLGPLLARLADTVSVSPTEGSENLVVSFAA